MRALAPPWTDTASDIAAEAAHATPESPARWLNPGEAWELRVDLDNPDNATTLSARLREAFANQPVDVNLLPDGPHRRKSLLIADMDSTIIQQECIDEIAAEAGVGAKVAAITEQAMRGELDFEAALTERVALLGNLDEAVLARVADNRLALTSGARTLVATMRTHGAYCALVSGGFTYFTSRIAALAGFHENRANTLDIRNGQLTGKVVPPILGRAAKHDALFQLLDAKNLPADAALAVGDGANDLAMIGAAGLGVAFHAKPIVAEEADASIVHGDLTGLLYLQGYTIDEFASG